ncbi:MAG: hypothetical protein IKB38_06235 [Clostridia bacterium]|nr:hypothetical protein [Clostridia bacterium]
MKKFVALLLLVSTLVMCLASCGALDAEKITEKLEEQGCTVDYVDSENFADYFGKYVDSIDTVTEIMIANDALDYILILFCNNEKNAESVVEELEKFVEKENDLNELYTLDEVSSEAEDAEAEKVEKVKVKNPDDYVVKNKKNIVCIGHEFFVDTVL